MPFGQVGVSGYRRRTSTGKVVNVSHYTQRRDLADIFSGLGRVGSISAKPGTFPGGRQIPTPNKSTKVTKAQLGAQKRQLAAMRAQVAALRKSAPADVAKNVEPAKKLLAKSFGTKKKTAAKKEDQAKKLASAEKLLKTRGADNEKLKEATNLLQSTADKQKSRAEASKKAAVTKQAAVDEMVKWIDANAAEIDANGVNVEAALKSTGITRDQLSNPDTPRTRAVTQEEWDALWDAGKRRIAEFQRESSPPIGLDDNWEAVKQQAYIAAQEEWGGMTMDTHTGVPLVGNEDLYALTVKDAGQESVSVPIGATPEEFDQAMDRARKVFDAQFQRQQHYLGVFNNVDTGLVEIDPVLVVDNLDDVESIGAYTRAVGGAYHFSDGLGYWPPFVGDKNEEFPSLRQVARKGEGDATGAGSNSSGQAGQGNDTGGQNSAGKANPSQEKALTYGPITPDEFQALDDYTAIGNGYRQINAKLRGTSFKPAGFGNASLAEEDVLSAIANLDALMEKSPLQSPVTVYRGYNPNWFQASPDEPLPIDTIIEDKGFVSFTHEAGVAFGFTSEKGSSKDVAVMKVTLPSGFPAINVDKRFSEHGQGDPNEGEFILPHGTKFRVVQERRPIGAGEEFPDANGDPAYIGDTWRKTGTIMTVEAFLPDQTVGGTNDNTAQGTGQALTQGQAGQATGVGPSGSPDLGTGGRENNAPTQAQVTTADAAAIATPSPKSLEAAKKVWNTDLGNGYRASVEDVRSTGYDDYPQHVAGIFSDSKGNAVGSFSRIIAVDPSGEMRAIHKSLFLSPDIQGQGLVSKFNAAAEEKYRQMGVKSIALSTDGVGGYAWARAGYDWQFDPQVDDRGILAEDVNRVLNSIDGAAYELYGEQNPDIYDMISTQIRELLQRVQRFEANDAADVTWLPTPYELSQIGWQPGADTWPGKNGMIGASWDGVKYLD